MPEDASLEQRLSSTSPEALAALKGQLKRQKIVPAQEMKKMPYYKYQLTDLITGYFRRNEREFSKDIYRAINKEPLKAVYYGMLTAPQIPKEFLSKLEPYEALYFMAGVWGMQELPEKLDKMDAFEIASVYIRAGMDAMAARHYREVKAGEYVTHINLPYDSKIRKGLATQKEIAERIGARKPINRMQMFMFDPKTLETPNQIWARYHPVERQSTGAKQKVLFDVA